MAAKYLRKQTWWVRFYHPRTRELVRESLCTGDEASAELLRKRVELEADLLNPCFQAAEVPDNVRRALGSPSCVADAGNATEAPLAPLAISPCVHGSPTSRVPLDEAIHGYFNFIRTDNTARHVENKLSMLRRFLGGERAEQFVQGDDSAGRTRRLKNASEAFFSGAFVDEVTPSLLQDFLRSWMFPRSRTG